MGLYKNLESEMTDDLTAQELYQLLEFPGEVQEKIREFERGFDYDTVRGELTALTTADGWRAARERLKEKLGEDCDGFGMLGCMVQAMRQTYRIYIGRNISREIFADTMKCFTRFLEEHYASFGYYGFDRDFWVGRQLALQLFRIGTLEYELMREVIPQCEETSRRGTHPANGAQSGSGDRTASAHGIPENVISIHIPSDARLTEESLAHSLQCADVFFKTYFPEHGEDCYMCNSWLLSPALKELLGANSNILRFQRLFDFRKWDAESPEFMEWVYKRTDIPVEELPENTSLQRKMKAHLLAGGLIGEGFGVLRKFPESTK